MTTDEFDDFKREFAREFPKAAEWIRDQSDSQEISDRWFLAIGNFSYLDALYGIEHFKLGLTRDPDDHDCAPIKMVYHIARYANESFKKRQLAKGYVSNSDVTDEEYEAMRRPATDEEKTTWQQRLAELRAVVKQAAAEKAQRWQKVSDDV